MPKPTKTGASMREGMDSGIPRRPMVPKVAIKEKASGVTETRTSCKSTKRKKRRKIAIPPMIRSILTKDALSSPAK
ncbi:hypothetical protein ES703_117172 [subsurface metagenome]